MTVRLVGVSPPEEHRRRPRLLGALQAAFPVAFEPREPGAWDGLDALVLVGDGPEPERLPTLRIRSVEPPQPHAAADVALGPQPAVDARLAARVLSERRAAGAGPLRGTGTVAAATRRGPLWLVEPGGRQTVAVGPAELDAAEPLAARLTAGRFLALLPLVQLLRQIAGASGWAAPPLRASFLFDDPNLHLPSYGHLRFAELARHAAEHDYRADFAMVPLDAWYAHPSAAALFRPPSPRLALILHGNDHLRRELARPQSEREALPPLAQALRRAARFERRYGVPVARVMAPPHGACSEGTVRALGRLGFEALCISRPYPWLEAPPADRPLARWEPADLVHGLPVLGRTHFDASPDELVLGAFLNRPIVLYGHHQDVAGGLERLAQPARLARSLGARFGSVEEVARAAYATQHDGDELRVRPYARIVDVDVPENVRTLRVEAPWLDPERDLVTVSGQEASEPVEVTGGRSVRVRIERRDPVDPLDVQPPPRRAWPIARRLLAEGRDRGRPLARRLRAQD